MLSKVGKGPSSPSCYKILTSIWDSHDEKSNTFVLKTYTTEEAQKDYTAESKAYRLLGKNQHIVNFYGNFTHTGSHNIIIERADIGSLETYFRETNRPIGSKNIQKFWHNLFGVLKALHHVHHVDQGGNRAREALKGYVTHTMSY